MPNPFPFRDDIVKRLQCRVRDLEAQLAEENRIKVAYYNLYTQELEKTKEIEAARQSNERMVGQLQANMEQNQKRHNDEITITRKKNEERIKILDAQKTQALSKMLEDHKNEMSNANRKHVGELAKLDEALNMIRKEGMEKIEKLEEQNEVLKQEQAKSQEENQVKIRKLMEDHHKESEKAKKAEQTLMNEVAEGKQKLLQLEQKYLEEADEKLDEEFKKRLALTVTRDAMKKFLKITKTVKDLGESLNFIKAHCSAKSFEALDDNVQIYLHEILSSKSMLKEEVYRFEQLLINEQCVQQEVLRACKDYVHKYENIMDQEKFFNLCINLPSAIKNKDQAEIEEFGNLAGNLSSELKDDREEIEKKLQQISSGNVQKSLE